jgi:hypothetical protein
MHRGEEFETCREPYCTWGVSKRLPPKNLPILPTVSRTDTAPYCFLDQTACPQSHCQKCNNSGCLSCGTWFWGQHSCAEYLATT